MTTTRRAGKTRPPVLASFRLLEDPLSVLRGKVESIPVGDNGHVWLSQSKHLIRHTIIGVPGKQITICLPPDNCGLLPKTQWVCRVTRKTGRYDRSERLELLITHWMEDQCRFWEEGYLNLTLDENAAYLSINEADGDFLWQADFTRLKSDLTGYNLAAVFEWHRGKYYRMLSYLECEELSAAFVASVQPRWTLAEANRVASRMLYGFARDNGWRKLTIREQQKYNVTGQWHRVAELEKVLVQSQGNKSSCGEYTATAATGKIPIYGSSAVRAAAEDWADRNGLCADIRRHLPNSVLAKWFADHGQIEYANAFLQPS